MNIEVGYNIELRNRICVFKVLVRSHSYNLNTETSDKTRNKWLLYQY